MKRAQGEVQRSPQVFVSLLVGEDIVVRRETNPQTYLAFELSALHELRGTEVAEVTGLTPSNCLFIDGELKLADFGLLTETGPRKSPRRNRTRRRVLFAACVAALAAAAAVSFWPAPPERVHVNFITAQAVRDSLTPGSLDVQ